MTMSRNREDLRKRRDASREGVSQYNANKMSVASKMRKLDEICDIDGGKELFQKMTSDKILLLLKDRNLKEANNIEQGNAALRRIIAGYQNAVDVDVGASVMQQ